MKLEIELPEVLAEALRYFTYEMGFKDMEEAVLSLVREGLRARRLLPIPFDREVERAEVKMETFAYKLVGWEDDEED